MSRTPAEWVDPLIDTANRRFFFFSSACLPFGMVNLSPDTVAGGGAWGAGYRYDTETVCWFSHVHGWQLSGIPVIPTTEVMRGHEGVESYKSPFSHDDEVVRAGYHRLHLDRYGIKAELTATDRVGFHRYTVHDAQDVYVLFDLTATIGPSEISDASITQVDAMTFEGWVENAPTRRRPKPVRIHFVARFDAPCDSFGGWRDGTRVKPSDGTVAGPGSGAFVHFALHDTDPAQRSDRTILLKVAISYCDVAGARNNLEHELPHWDFDRVHADATAVWNSWLSRIEVEGGTDAQRTKFYTDLYHALLGRRRVSDADGRYVDNTGERPIVRRIPLDDAGRPRYEHHNSDAFWGAQWSINVLWSLAWPEVVGNFCATFLDYYRNGGLIPRGPSGGNYTFVMTGASSTPLFVSAWQKGIREFDVELAYEGLRKNHLPGGLMSRAGYEHHSAVGGGVEYYIERGYIPWGIQAEAFHCDGPAQTLEYAFQDWALAQLAAALGKDEDAALFSQRARNYRNVFNLETAFMQPKTLEGEWLEPFDPDSPDGWNEGNGWHYLWWVPHDPDGLAELMGGRDVFVRRLDEQFRKAEPGSFIAPHGRHHENVIDYGNQPCTHLAHLFSHVGAPWLSQKWVRRVSEAAKSDISPYGGYGGDEDQGMMGSLNALMAMGLFQMRGGCDPDPIYELTAPIFDRITIHLSSRYHGGGTFTIETGNNSRENIYIQSASLNGRHLAGPWLRQSDLRDGGVLTVVLGPEPETTGASDRHGRSWAGPRCPPHG